MKTTPQDDLRIDRRDAGLQAKRRSMREVPLKSHGVSDIVVPEGRLGSFYWYESDPELYSAEVEAMRRYFPAFRLVKESDGRLAWIGQVTPGLIGKRVYTLRAVYDHSHPSNNTYGGSVRVYSVDPDLEELAQGARIPHTLRDSENKLYLCTAGPESIRMGRTAGSTVTTAATSIAWAVKWLIAFELWLNNDLTEAEVSGLGGMD